LSTHALQPLDKCSFCPVKSDFKNAAAFWLKQNPQHIITRYHMARFSGFAWNKAASMGADISAFESMGTFPLNRIIVPEYFFSISDTSDTVPFTEKAPPDMAPIWNQPSVLPISGGTSLSTLNAIQLSDSSPEEVTLTRHL
jgi:hypothetical protein